MTDYPTSSGAHSDGINQQFSIIGVQGTLGTADTGGTALTIPIGVNPSTGAAYVDLQSSGTIPLPTGASTSSKQDTQTTLLQGIAGFVPSVYDSVTLSYTGSNLTGVVFKNGGTTVSTLTLAYTGSQLDSVTKT